MKKASNEKRASLKVKNLNNTSGAAQRSRLLNALIERGSEGVTTLYSREQLNIMHPAGRINELRDEGHEIVTHWDDSIDSEGFPHRVARYVLLALFKEVAA